MFGHLRNWPIKQRSNSLPQARADDQKVAPLSKPLNAFGIRDDAVGRIDLKTNFFMLG